MCLYCCCTVSDLILYIIAVFLPPVAVAFRSGICSSDLLLNVLLTMLGIIPGMIHAFYYINMTSPLRRNGDYVFYYQQGWSDSERHGGASSSRQYNQSSTPQGGANYGSTENSLPRINPKISGNPSNKIDGKNSPSSAPPPYSETP